MRLPSEPDPPPSINIVPMIDVIFAILTFFVLSTLFLTRSEGLPVNLPGAATAELQPQEQTVVTIDASGNLLLNQQPITLDALDAAVRQRTDGGNSPLVVINADKAVPHGQVVAVMDRLRAIPNVRLAIATERP
ncbi:biopolymer transporter ExbD [Thermoleptolyngbya sichuanensis A183]|uniref:Biopolymer transporter ExbD n=1 Tax=Thermoleptolyngbya sichuanensis A183 TaxID=2737172 RepID=A0A6M8B4T5_9CYAN|nr:MULTISPECIES: biopolymer transporter ExbD [Thermoleptolyngbya]MDG2617981.1 biopolymer transporter ExbD [Thermoleptolyngbya sichuanensis XZ-Cy5]QKD82299.1 biopolymer transporter ExbD [Thermoleptolyngbya sichuanensis A183]